ncbi:hypothetical protein E8E14_006455 [Neopestalotiopsis sp. 37M]|nr:hypothetical protein E8E14_006455 [Neopestalotiopsis sp. 37M]
MASMRPRMTPAVRSYSLQLKADKSAGILYKSLALVAAEEQKEIENRDSSEQEWRNWLLHGESFCNEDHERLNDRCKEAVKLWKELCRRSHNGSDVEIFTIPTLEKLSAATNKMISDSKSTRESGFHAARESFLDFVSVMSDYSYIFSVFPSGDKYISVITGVLSTISKNFNDNDVNPRIDAVKKGVERFLLEMQYDTAVVVRKTASQVDGIPNKIAGDVCEKLKGEIGKLMVGVSAGEYLGSVEEHITHDHDRALLVSDSTQLMSCELAQTTSAVETPVAVETEPFATIDRLAPFIDNGRESLMNEDGALTRPTLPEEVVLQMQDWIKDPTSSMLWVEGVEVYSGPLLSMAALYPFRSQSRLSSAEALFISFLYSIVAQLSEILEVDFNTSANKELRDSLLQLDGGIESSKLALRLIEELMSQLPYMTVWIVDDIHLTESGSTLPYLENFLEILRNKSSESVVKVLFTTKGNSRLLCGNLQVTERVDASRMAQERGGHVMPGGASFY